MGISIPQVFFDGPIDMPLIERWSKRAEDLGFESLWTQEAITGAVPHIPAARADRIREREITGAISWGEKFFSMRYFSEEIYNPFTMIWIMITIC